MKTEEYDNISRHMRGGLRMVSKNHLYGFINEEGAEVIPCQYDYACSTPYNMITVKKNGLWGLINNEGEVLIPCRLGYDEMDAFTTDGLCKVKMNGHVGFIDEEGNEFIPCTLDYDEIFNFHDGLAFIERNGLKGFINQQGVEVIPCQYDWIYPSEFSYDVRFFQDGVCKVEKDGVVKTIDMTGKEV